MIEETDVVVRFFDRLDLARDELIEFGELGDQIGRQCQKSKRAPEASLLPRLR